MQKQNIPLAIFLIAVLGICLIGCLGIGLAIRFMPNIYRHSPQNNSVKIGSSAPDFDPTSLAGQTMGHFVHWGALKVLRPNDMPIIFHKLALIHTPGLNCFAASQTKIFNGG